MICNMQLCLYQVCIGGLNNCMRYAKLKHFGVCFSSQIVDIEHYFIFLVTVGNTVLYLIPVFSLVHINST